MLIPIWEKSLSFKVMACFVLEFGAIYWPGGGKHPPGMDRVKLHNVFITRMTYGWGNLSVCQGLGKSAFKTFQNNSGVSRFTLEWLHCVQRKISVYSKINSTNQTLDRSFAHKKFTY